MYTPLLTPKPSSSKFSATHIFPSIVCVLFVMFVLLNDSYFKQEEAPVGGNPWRAPKMAKPPAPPAPCSTFEETTKIKCSDRVFGAFWARYHATIDMRPESVCKGEKCVPKDRFRCCVKPLLCLQYEQSSGATCPDKKEPSASISRTCTKQPCTKAADESHCCVPANSQYIARKYVEVFEKPDSTSKRLDLIRTGAYFSVSELTAEEKKTVKDPKLEWGKYETLKGEFGFVLLKDEKGDRDNVRKLNTQVVKLTCDAKGDFPAFKDAKADSTFQIKCPAFDECDFKQYEWKVSSPQTAFSGPDLSSEKLKDWTWPPTDTIKFTKVEEHENSIWGYQPSECVECGGGWFRLLDLAAPYKHFATMQGTGVTGCATTRVRKWVDYVKRDSPICLAARTRYQFGGNMEITFGKSTRKFRSCDNAGVLTTAAEAAPSELSYQVGLAGQQMFKTTSNRLNEVIKRKIMRMKQPGAGKVMVKMLLKGILGICLALAVGALTSAVIAGTGGAALAGVPLLIGIAFAIPQGFAAHALGLVIEVSVDHLWDKVFPAALPKEKVKGWMTKLKEKFKTQTKKDWIGGGMKGMLWPLIGHIPGAADAVGHTFGNLLTITPGQAPWLTGMEGGNTVHLSIAFSGWIMNTIFGLFKQASDRGLTRLDVFAQMLGLIDYGFQSRRMRAQEGGTPVAPAAGGEPAEPGVVHGTDAEQDKRLADAVSSCSFAIGTCKEGEDCDEAEKTKSCILEFVTVDDTGSPVIPMGYVGALATNIGLDWKICEEEQPLAGKPGEAEKPGEVEKTETKKYYCLAEEGKDDIVSSTYLEDFEKMTDEQAAKSPDAEELKLGESSISITHEPGEATLPGVPDVGEIKAEVVDYEKVDDPSQTQKIAEELAIGENEEKF